MNDLEERISVTLQERAPVFVTPMPKGTLAKVRRRQAVTSLTALTVVAGLVVLAVGAVSALPRAADRPAGQQTVPAPNGVLPNLQGEQGGADDATAAPVSEPTATEDTTAHGTTSTEPYTEQVTGQEAYLLTQKHVVAFGHVSAIEWSLAGYDTRAYSGIAFPAFLGGSCGDLMVGDQGEYGGIEFCLHTDETPANAAFAMAGFGNDLDEKAGPITGYAGLVGDRVATVELRLSDGTTKELPLYDAPSGIDARYFAVFLKAGAAGHIVALGSDGSELDSGGLCISEPPKGADNVGCGHGLVNVSSVVTSLSGEPVIP
jgi:hypothetical protein